MLQDRSRLNLRCRIKARAWAMLALFSKPLIRQLTVRASDETHQVTITVAPAGGASQGAAPPDQFPGNHFSPLEASIYHALAAGPLLGKVIARRVTQDYTPRLKTILSNLVERQVLTHNDDGYARAVRETKGRA